MAHSFVFDSETDTDHVFRCTACGRIIGFNKPEIGAPNALVVDGVIVPPPNVEDYVTPCAGGE